MDTKTLQTKLLEIEDKLRERGGFGQHDISVLYGSNGSVVVVVYPEMDDAHIDEDKMERLTADTAARVFSTDIAVQVIVSL